MVVEVQLSALMPVEVVPSSVAVPPAPHLVLSAWILVSEPTSSAPKVKALPTCRQSEQPGSQGNQAFAGCYMQLLQVCTRLGGGDARVHELVAEL